MASFYVAVYLAVFLAAAGQVMLKIGSNSKSFGLGIVGINKWIILGLGAMVASMLLNVRGLSVVPLKDMAFILPTIYIIIPVFSRIFLKETIHKNTVAGTIILLFGIILFNVPILQLF